MKNVQPFVPFDLAGKYDNPGGLSASAHIETSKDEEDEEKKKHLLDKAYIENGTDIVWPGPYAPDRMPGACTTTRNISFREKGKAKAMAPDVAPTGQTVICRMVAVKR